MSSLHRQHGKPYWYCAYTDQTGQRHFRSTKTSDKKEAKRVCDELQRVVDLARAGTLNEDRVRQVIESAVAGIIEASGKSLPHFKAGEFIRSWLKDKEREIDESTFRSYSVITNSFLEFLGPKQNQSIASLTSKDIRLYRDKVAERVSTGTVNNHLKMLRVAFGVALKENAITKNPAVLVDNLARSDKHKRRAFTPAELRKVLAHVNVEWRTMTLLGVYTGLRLSDCANLTWQNLDLHNQELTLETQKTERTVSIPLAQPLLKHIKTLLPGDDQEAPLCPGLFGKPSGQLSNSFHYLLAIAGLVPHRDRTGQKKELHGRRKQNDLCFHCLRHTATSMLKNSGVSDAVAKDLLGHDSESIGKVYTHISTEAKREAIAKLPDVTT